RYEGEAFGPALVLRGARERLSPILMTTLATGLAIVPLVVAGNLPGHEIEHPMAVVILAGLFTSTLLNLFVVPSLYLRFGRQASGPRARGGREQARAGGRGPGGGRTTTQGPSLAGRDNAAQRIVQDGQGVADPARRSHRDGSRIAQEFSQRAFE